MHWSGVIASARLGHGQPHRECHVGSHVLISWRHATVILLINLGNVHTEINPVLANEHDWVVSETANTPYPITLTIFTDNDSAYYKPNDDSDRQYTAGNGFAIDHQPIWADRLAPHVPFADTFGPATTGAGHFAFHLLHSPDNLRLRAPTPGDRPYSGHFNFGAFWQRVNAQRTTMDHFQVEMGFVGPSAAGEPIQKWIHRIFDAQEPMGWNNQLVDELTFNLRIRKKWRALKHPADGQTTAARVDLIPQIGVDAGTVRSGLNAQITSRVGVNMPDDFGPANLFDFGDATSHPPTGLGFCLFGSMAGSLVFHDLYLDGTVFRSSPITVDSSPLVGTFRFGTEVTYTDDAWSLAVGYSQTWLTEEFSTVSAHHSYSSWTMTLDIEF